MNLFLSAVGVMCRWKSDSASDSDSGDRARDHILPVEKKKQESHPLLRLHHFGSILCRRLKKLLSARKLVSVFSAMNFLSYCESSSVETREAH